MLRYRKSSWYIRRFKIMILLVAGEMTSISILHWWGNPASFPANKIEVSGNKAELICTHSNIIGLTLHCPSEHTLVSGQKLPSHLQTHDTVSAWHYGWVSTPHYVNIHAICKPSDRMFWDAQNICTHCRKQEDIHVASEGFFYTRGCEGFCLLLSLQI